MIFIGVYLVMYLILLFNVFTMWDCDVVVSNPIFMCGISVFLVVLGSMSGIFSGTNTLFSMGFILSGFILLLYFADSVLCISLKTGFCVYNRVLFKNKYFRVDEICYIKHYDKSVEYVCFYNKDNSLIFMIGRYYRNFNVLIDIIKELRVVD